MRAGSASRFPVEARRSGNTQKLWSVTRPIAWASVVPGEHFVLVLLPVAPEIHPRMCNVHHTSTSGECVTMIRRYLD